MRNIFLVSMTSLFFLSGCVEDRVQFVETEMEKIKLKSAKEVAPPPVFEQVQSVTYSANDLRSPFMPPTLSERLAEEEAIGSQVEPDLDRPQEQLEQYELNQLTMKGVIQDTQGEIYALIEEPTGTVVKTAIGSYMGKNHGRVVDIKERQVDLIEIVPNGTKGYVERSKTLLATEG